MKIDENFLNEVKAKKDRKKESNSIVVTFRLRKDIYQKFLEFLKKNKIKNKSRLFYKFVEKLIEN